MTSREHHRVQFSLQDCPKLIIENEAFNIVDLAERGIHFAVETKQIVFAQPIEGLLVKRFQKPLSVVAKYLGTEVGQLVFTTTQEIPHDYTQLDSGTTLTIGNQAYAVQSVDNWIIRFFPGQNGKMLFPCQGRIRLHDQRVIPVSGELIRMQMGCFVLRLNESLPYDVIVHEQVYVMGTAD